MKTPYNEIDKDLDVLLKQYNKLNQEQYDELVDILNGTELNNKPITQEEKARLKRYAKKHDATFDLVILTLAYLLSKRVLTNTDVFEVKILLLLDKFYKIYDTINRRTFNAIYKKGYDDLLKDIGKPKKKSILNKLKSILKEPIVRQYLY